MSAATGRRVIWNTPSITANGLKNFACVTMFLYSVGVIVIEQGLIHINEYTQAGLSEALSADARLMNLAGYGSVLELLGGLSVPLFAFLLVEGFLNTSDFWKYFVTMALTAVVSELPYDLAMRGKLLDFTGQNALFAMVISLVMLYCLKYAGQRRGFLRIVLQFLSVFGAVLWVTLLRVEFGLCIVLLVADFYIFYARNGIKTVLGILFSLMYVTGPLSFYGIWCYNGQRTDKFSKYVYYAFYPLHMLVLWLIAKALP